MSTTLENHQLIDLNPLLSATKDGTILFSNNASEPLLQEWRVEIGQKLPSNIVDLLQRVISRNSPEKIEVKAGNKVYLIVFSPLPEQECVNISGFDISDHKEKGEETQQNEERLKALMDHNPSLIFMKDEYGRYVYLNKAYEEQFVLSKDWYGKTDFDFWSKESAELFRENDSDVLKSGQIQQFLENSNDLYGTRFCWLCYKFPFTDSKNKRYVGGIGIDTTDRVRAEEALQESKARIESIFQSSPIGIGIVVNRMIIEANEKLCEMTGYSREELLGKSAQILYPTSEEYERVGLVKYGMIAERDTGYMETRWKRKDGSIIDILISSSPIVRGDLSGEITFTALDITERKKAEKELQESNNYLQLTLKNVSAGMWIRGNDGSWIATSQLNSLFGRSPDAPPMREDEFSEFIYPEDFSRIQKAWYEAINKESSYEQDYRVIWPDGSIHWLASKGRVIKESDVPKFVGITFDITERKRVEEALRESKAQLSSDLAGLQRLYELNSKLANETDLKVALDEILGVAIEFTGTERGTVQLISNDGESLEIVAHRGYNHGNRFIEHFKKGGSKPACDAARRQRKRLIIEEVETFLPLAGTKDQEVALAEGIRATQSTPMISQKGETIGVLSTQFSHPHHPSDHELKLIDLLAWTSANFIERHFSDKALLESEKRFKLLSETNALLLSSKDPEKVIQIIAEKVLNYLNCNIFFNYIFDKTQDRLLLNAYGGISAEAVKEIEWLNLGSAICGYVALDGSRIVSEDVQNNGDKRADLVRSMGIQAYACQPLRIGEETIGTLSFGKRNSKIFASDELTLMSTVADQVSIAIGRARIEEALKKANETLEEKVKERTTELEKAYKFLQEIEIIRKQEIHHRIKNNLQVISSLLDLQAEKFKGKKKIEDSQVLEAFKESQDRVISMALIHEELHKGGEIDTLNFSHYIEKLADNLMLSYRVGNDSFSLDMDIDEGIFFDMDTAIPLGIIINELVSNSLKYAFPERDEGEIQIKLYTEEVHENKTERSKSKTFTLSVSDNGIGIPEDIDIECLDSLGLQLITTLVEQLDGELELKRNNGTRFIIKFTVTEELKEESLPAVGESVTADKTTQLTLHRFYLPE